jgi:vacuolar-type H+-ATPase subunit F/Vma7
VTAQKTMSEPVPVYIGDEVSACGYRLAGLETRVPAENNLAAELESIISDATLVLLSAEIAGRLTGNQREQLLARVNPPVVVVPDVRGHAQLTDMATRLRKQLGVLE